MVTKSKTKQNKENKSKMTEKKKGKKLNPAGSRTPMIPCGLCMTFSVLIIALNIAPRHHVLNVHVKSIIFNGFAHEILPVDAV